jgi:enoyl-CoA hydratase
VTHALFDEAVGLRVDGDVLWAVLDRPHARNAINLEVIEGLEHMLALAREHHVKVVVIRGAGNTFCSGADLRELRNLATNAPELESFMTRLGAVFDELERAPWVTVAVVEGYAIAGGCELILASDISIAASSAQIGDGHVIYGLAPAAGGSVRLPAAVGPTLARFLLLTGQLLTGAEAARQGLVTMAVDASDLEERVNDVVGRLKSRGTATVRTIKTMLMMEAPTARNSLLTRERRLFLAHINESADADVGLAAFAERRLAVFDE